MDAKIAAVGPRSTRMEKLEGHYIRVHWYLPPEVRERFLSRKLLSNNLVSKSYTGKNEAEKSPPKLTTGSLRNATEAFVYVGQCRRTDRIKIGMSSKPLQRAKSLAVELLFTVPVVVAQAKLVETYALRGLGAVVGDSEWVFCTPEEAIDAVCAGWVSAARVAHVNPLISEDDARLQRVRMAA